MGPPGSILARLLARAVRGRLDERRAGPCRGARVCAEREVGGIIRRGKEACDAAQRVPEVIVEDVTRRVVFLDFDGVLAPIRRWDRYGDLDPACIQVLNEIVARGEAEVVVSSTWRHGKTVAELQEILKAEGFTGFVLDKTPTGAPGADRGEEIAAWLTEHAVDGYVIIDDHLDMGALRSRLVQTHPARGLQPADTPRAIAMLMRPTTG
jgi:hypothetical protein